MTKQAIRSLTNNELQRELAHARNKRDAFSMGNEPAEVMRHLRDLLDEQDRRRSWRQAERYAAVSRVGYEKPKPVK